MRSRRKRLNGEYRRSLGRLGELNTLLARSDWIYRGDDLQYDGLDDARSERRRLRARVSELYRSGATIL